MSAATVAGATPATPALPARLRRTARWTLPKLATVAVLLAVWQGLFLLQDPADALWPSPGMVLDSFRENLGNGHLQVAVVNTLRRAALGYAFSIVVGTSLGAALGRVRLLQETLGSFIAALQSLPSVAWVPVAVIAFGTNEKAVFFVVVLGALPSIANGTAAAMAQIPPPLIRAGRAMGASGLALYRHVYLPAALPGYLAGLTQGWAFSWRSLMAAELIAVGLDLPLGIGSLLESGRSLVKLDLMLMCIVVILFVGLAVDSLVFSPIQHTVRKRRGLAAD